MELAVVKYIKTHGLEATIKKFKLNFKEYENKIILKYNMIESPLECVEVQDARGLILEKGTWNVLSLGLRKFFNAEEEKAAKIDWKTAYVLEKVDGSMIQVYWDWIKNEWFAGTTGMAEGEGEVNNKLGTTFAQLFWQTVEKVTGTDKGQFTNRLLKGKTYVFELCTPYNIVVTPHATSSVTLLMVRHLYDLSEFTYEYLGYLAIKINVPLVKRFSLKPKDFGELKRTFDGMPFTEEGYVVVDANFNRVKVKNPAYLSAHHLKGKLGNHHIMGIIKSNEIEEFIATFKERETEIRLLEYGYKLLIEKLSKCWGELLLLKPKNITPQEKKKFAMNVFNVIDNHGVKEFSGLFFGLNDGKIKSINEYMLNYDDRKLYNLLIK